MSDSLTLAAKHAIAWTTPDYIALAGVIVTALTAGVIIWYTLETRRIRMATMESNKLLSSQINDLKEQEMTRRRLSAPLFDSRGNSQLTNFTQGVYELGFTNTRGRALSIQLESPSNVNGAISGRTDMIGTGEPFQIRFFGEALKDRNVSFEFSIKYRDELGTLWKATYSCNQRGTALKELKMENDL